MVEVNKSWSLGSKIKHKQKKKLGLSNVIEDFFLYKNSEILAKNLQNYEKSKKFDAAIADNESERYVIILEDLRVNAFKMSNKSKPIPIENMRLAMRENGKLHGISLAMKQQRPNEFAEFEKFTDLLGPLIKRLPEVFELSFDRAIELLKVEEHRSIMRNIKNNLILYLDSILNVKSPFPVVSHGKYTFISFNS